MQSRPVNFFKTSAPAAAESFPAFQMEGNTSVKAELIEIPIADWTAVDRLEL